MASSVFYKFSSRKDESRVTFDGTGISVFDLKREIILANNMEHKDDSQIIPRSSSVIVKRLPAARPGKGKASMYLAGTPQSLPSSEPVLRGSSINSGTTYHKGAMSKRFDGKDEQTSLSKAPLNSIQSPTSTKGDEAAAMAAMFQAQTQNWEETQEKMSHATRIYSSTRGTGFSRGGKPHTPNAPHQVQNDRPLPPSYVCYRCGKKGHWIQDCPTNNDREFDNRPRIKRTTGIPRSMLKAVENPNNGELTQGVMVTPEGGYVVAQPDLASWQKQVSRPKGLTAAEVREKVPTDPLLTCPIDNKLFRDAVKTPCCGTLYCEECVQTHLLERDFICPNCSKKIASLDKLLVDKPTRTMVSDYIEKAIEESKREGGEESAGDVPNGQQSTTTEERPFGEQDIYSEQQPDLNMDMSQILVDQIPQLQAQATQLYQMLQNANLPDHVRHQTEMHHQQLQIQLSQAQAISAALAVANFQQQQQAAQNAANNTMGFNMQGGFQQQQMGQWNNNNQFSNQQQQQPASQDSAYQRLPVNSNRRRNLKRDRPTEFFETTAPDGTKIPRYWE